MKELAEPIPLNEPLRDVKLRNGVGLQSDLVAAEQLQARYEQGRRDGEKALREQLLVQRNELLELQQGVLRSLLDCLPHVRKDCEQGLIALALEVAQKIVGGVPISPEMLEAAVREALEHCEATQELTVLMHAEDLALLQRVNAPILVTTLAGEKLRFQSSPEVTRGGCMVQTRFGVVDARRQTKFELLKKSLQN
jgi:flagellar assembly protein FliH